MSSPLTPAVGGAVDPLADRLGRGWAFPPQPVGVRWPWVSGPAAVRQALRLLMATEPGERVMRPDFGCPLRQYLMAPNNAGTRAALADTVRLAVGTWEPRIALQGVEVAPTADPGTVLVTVSYVHLRDGTPGDLQIAAPVGAG